MKKRSVIIDLDDTLIESENLRKKGQEKAVAFLVKELKNDKIVASYNDFKKVKDEQYKMFSDGRLSNKRMRFDMFLKKYGIKGKTLDDLTEKSTKIYFTGLGRFKEYKNSTKFLFALKKAGYKIIIFSHATTEEAYFKMQRMKKSTVKLIDKVYSTDKYGITKYPLKIKGKDRFPKVIPLGMLKNVKTYSLIKKKDNAIAMFGDSKKHDIIPAKEAGLKSFFVSKGSFVKSLKEFLI